MASADVDLAALVNERARRPQAVGKLTRRLYEIGVRVRVTGQPGNGSQIEVTLIGHGRGVLRPIVLIAAVLFKKLLKREMQKGLAHFGASVERFADVVRTRHGAQPAPRETARMLLDALLDAVAETAPAQLPGDDLLGDLAE